MRIRLYNAILLFLAMAFFFTLIYLNTTVKVLEEKVADFTPIRDDAIARRFAPTLISNSDFGLPIACYYRAARDIQGNVHIAYHPVWEYERNSARGIMPFLSRIIYTGGISLQRIMFGKGDVEMISVIVSPKGNLVGIQYEKPKNYNPSTFTVEHQKVMIKKNFTQMPAFRVASWNHLFEIEPSLHPSLKTHEKMWKCNPIYFTNELWNEYTMVQLKETRLRRSRAHMPWERIGIE